MEIFHDDMTSVKLHTPLRIYRRSTHCTQPISRDVADQHCNTLCWNHSITTELPLVSINALEVPASALPALAKAATAVTDPLQYLPLDNLHLRFPILKLPLVLAVSSYTTLKQYGLPR